MQDNVSQIKEALRIEDVLGEYVKLKKAGINFSASCPFHNEKTPSFFVSPIRQSWKCFGCGKGGDMFTFIEEIEGVEFYEALTLLAQKAGVVLQRVNFADKSKKERSFEVLEEAANYFNRQLLSEKGSPIKEYILSRGITEKSIQEFLIGYSPLSSFLLQKHLSDSGYTASDAISAGLGYENSRDKSLINRFYGRIMFPIKNPNGKIVGFGGED